MNFLLQTRDEVISSDYNKNDQIIVRKFMCIVDIGCLAQ